MTLFKAAALGGEEGELIGVLLMEFVGDLVPAGEPAVEPVGGAGGEVLGVEVGEDAGAEDGGVDVDGGDAVGVAVGDTVGETLGAGVGLEDVVDLVGAELGAWPSAQLTMRAKRTKQAKVLAIVEF